MKEGTHQVDPCITEEKTGDWPRERVATKVPVHSNLKSFKIERGRQVERVLVSRNHADEYIG